MKRLKKLLGPFALALAFVAALTGRTVVAQQPAPHNGIPPITQESCWSMFDTMRSDSLNRFNFCMRTSDTSSLHYCVGSLSAEMLLNQGVLTTCQIRAFVGW